MDHLWSKEPKGAAAKPFGGSTTTNTSSSSSGARIFGRADDEGARAARRGRHAHVEVGETRAHALVEENVIRLDVRVDDATSVQVGHRLAQREQQLQHEARREGRPLAHGAQSAVGVVGHLEVEAVVRLEERFELDHGRMLALEQKRRLFVAHLESLRIDVVLLECDGAAVEESDPHRMARERLQLAQLRVLVKLAPHLVQGEELYRYAVRHTAT